MSVLEPSNHWACAFDATLSIAAASAGRVGRHASAVAFACEVGSTQNAAPTMGLPVTGTGGAFVGPSDVASAMAPSGEIASPAHADRPTSAAIKRTCFPPIQFLFLVCCARHSIGIDR